MNPHASRPKPLSMSLACLALALVSLATTAESRKDKCLGTKQDRKQKLPARTMSGQQFQQATAEYAKTVAADLEGVRQAGLRRLEREYSAHQATGAPFQFDVLVLSGGGAKGAFGTGFLEGWGEVAAGPDARPEFDMVTGVSTGALIAPFAFIGTDEAYGAISRLYANPEPNWATKRGLLPFLPGNPSLFNNCHLRDAIWEAADLPVVEAVAAAARADRILMVGVTNLDLGKGRALDLGHAARTQAPADARDEIVTALVASSSIPGVFAPVLIDGMLYADGGATSNLFVVTFPGPGGPVARFLEAHPGVAPPKLRLWVVVNQKLNPPNQVVEPRWVTVSGQALNTLTSTSQRFALGLMQDMVREARAEGGLDVEMRFVSIPDSGPEPATKALFDKAYMLKLQELGRAMGADPSSWQATLPPSFAAPENAGE